MSLNSKLQTALAVVFILASAGASSVIAQTQSVAENMTTKGVAVAGSHSEPNRVASVKPTAASVESTAPAGAAEVRRASEDSSVATPAAPQGTNNDKWEFQFAAYFWMAGLHGDAGIGNRSAHVDESFGDIFHALDFALMGAFEAQKGRLVILTNMEYVSVSDEKATPGPLFSNVDSKFKIFIVDPEVGYRVYENPDKGAWVDVMGGARMWHLSTDLAFGAGILPATNPQASRNWVDAVAGLRFKAGISKKTFVTGRFDLGGGGSKFTWRAFGGLGYSITPKIALVGGYRALDVNYNKDNFIYDTNQRGPIVGIGFKF